VEDQGDNLRWGHKWIRARTESLHDNLKKLQVIESKRTAIRKGLVYELLNAPDTVLCSYFAQRSGERSECQGGAADERVCCLLVLNSAADEVFQGLDNFG